MESCADIFRLSAFLCFAITASICFRSLRVSFPADNRVHLLVEFILFLKCCVEILCAVRSFLWSDKEDICHVPHYLLLSVFLIHRKQEERQHHEHHNESGGACLRMRSENEKKRYADNRTAAKADELPFC